MSLKENTKIRSYIHHIEKSIEEKIKQPNWEFDKKLITYRHMFTKKHSEFGVATYVREMSAPRGVTIIGYLQKHSHVVMLTKGAMRVLSEEGEEFLKAPCTFISPIGIKRLITFLEDCIMTCIYQSDDPEKDKENLSAYLEEELTRFESELFTENYMEVGLEPPILSNSMTGVVSWQE